MLPPFWSFLAATVHLKGDKYAEKGKWEIFGRGSSERFYCLTGGVFDFYGNGIYAISSDGKNNNTNDVNGSLKCASKYCEREYELWFQDS